MGAEHASRPLGGHPTARPGGDGPSGGGGEWVEGGARAAGLDGEPLVGEAGLEPAISCSQSTCVSQLRHSPASDRGHDTAPGAVACSLPLQKPRRTSLGARRRAARPRWEIRCFSSAAYSPKVRPPGGSRAGSKIGS